jgi:anti-sigma factor RsiW
MNTTPSEYEIHAYVDGHLDESRREAVEFYLARHPERAEQVRAWQRGAQQLRAQVSGLDLPENPALDPAYIRARRHTQLRLRWARAAVLVLSLALGAVGGWEARGWRQSDLEPPMADALQAHRMFAPDTGSRFDVVYKRNSDMQGWLDSHFERAPRLPDLHAAGFLPVGARLLATAEGSAAMVFYQDQQGDTISFYVRPPSAGGTLPRGHRQEGNLVAEYGSDNGYYYAMVSRADTRDLQIVRGALGPSS